jgi:hypothetical protein
MIDGKPRARTATVQDAAALAHRFLQAEQRESPLATASNGDRSSREHTDPRALQRT